jgi:hypothetical protein
MWQKIKDFLFSPPVLENLSNKVHPLDGPTRKAMAVQQPVVTAPVEVAPAKLPEPEIAPQPELVVETKPTRKPRAKNPSLNVAVTKPARKPRAK